MSYARILEEAKRRIVEVYEADMDYLYVANALSVSRRNAWNLVCRYLHNGQVVRQRGGLRQQVVRANQEMKDCLVDIKKDPAFTLKQINEELRRRLPNKTHVSTSTIAWLLEGQLIFLKKMDAPSGKELGKDKADSAQVRARDVHNWHQTHFDLCRRSR